MKYENRDMKYPIPNTLEFTLDSSFLVSLSGALDRLSNLTINVYDFYIIMYFHLGQIMQNKPNFVCFSPINADFTKNKPNSKPIQTQFNPKQTQLKPIQSQNKPNFSTLKAAISDAFGCHTNIYYILSNELWRF
jgi:hypothetical protein